MLFIDDVDKMTGGDILMNLMLGYNLIVHFPVVLLNFGVLAKEASMYFFQFLHTQGDSTYSINGADFVSAWKDIVWAADPFTYIDYVSGEDYEGEIYEWGEDEWSQIGW